ncbi:MAG TPA: hypothetical protein VLF91_05405 [Candidatus Saccharimonadales bacterium]|nr:hypothetical protein [Candidatus Saccharimonadales bacterium]
MIRKTRSRPLYALATAVLVCASLAGPWAARLAHADGDTVDEIHYAFGSAAEGSLTDSVVFDWRGQEQNIYYGLDSSYGQTAVAQSNARFSLPPKDTVDLNLGPIREVTLSGLQPSTTYHYKIGATGLDHTFQTIPAGDFTWVDVGDTASTLCDPWMAQTHQTIANLSPTFVTHGGDMTYANACGEAAVHQYFNDQQLWSTGAAFQPSFGNHEYGNPNSDEGITPPPGTPRDSMSNYKARLPLTNAQTVPNDTTSQINNPGCGWETGSATNTCQGDDWGWFETGHVLFIAYPEPWYNAQTAWEPSAAALMTQAQNDPNIDFIVTYGHRPGYTSVSAQLDSTMTTALSQLAQSYSPSASNPNGKYILNVAHHAHNREVFQPINGLVNIVDGGGGAGQTSFDATLAQGSIWRTVHPGVLQGVYNATQHSLTINMVCGAVYNSSTKEPCIQGTVQYTQTFTRPNTPAQPQLNTTLSDNLHAPQIGQQVTYTVGVANQVASTTASGTTLSLTLPAQQTIVNAGGGTVNGQTVSWDIGYLAGGQPAAAEQVVTQVASGTPGDTQMALATTATTDNSCQNSGSVCSASDSVTIAASQKQWIGNPGVETDMTGWAGVYGPIPQSNITRDITVAHGGAASIKVLAPSGASNASLGFNDNPRWVLSTVAGTVYSQSAWVKPTFVGQKLNLRVREWRGSTLVTDKFVTLTAADTNWHQLNQTLTAGGTGNQLSFAVYASGFNAGQSFYADDFSLTTPN